VSVSAAVQFLEQAAVLGWTAATAESLTGGLLCARLVDVPADLLATRGAVDPEVAQLMAQGVRRRLGADVGLATTGVAGPDMQDGRPPGTVHVAVVTPRSTQVRSLALDGDREHVREACVAAVLALALEALAR